MEKLDRVCQVSARGFQREEDPRRQSLRFVRRHGAVVMLVDTSKRGVNRLQEKGTYRKKGGASGILGMYPAGTGEVGKIKERPDFPDGSTGDEQWYKHVEEGTSGFSEAHRAKTTAYEHAMYMRNISDWAVTMGFAPLVEPAEAPGSTVFEGLKLVEVDGRPNVIRPEMIVAMLSLMSVGDSRAPKNLKLVQKIRKEEKLLARVARSRA